VNIMASRAGKLYRDTTPAELAMEEAVAKLGVPYRIQFPYYLWGVRFFPDFVLPTLKLIIEVDDESHNEARKQEADAQRTAELNALGWVVVRCTNQEALDDAPGTLKNLLRTVRRHPDSPLCTLRAGLPQRVAKQGKMTRGALRDIRLERSKTPPLFLPDTFVPRVETAPAGKPRRSAARSPGAVVLPHGKPVAQARYGTSSCN
jgi:very-short-patch-repair endonuclease